ncbi:DUF1348 family protein [Mycobacterium leprae]|uniref:DUF1348 family protein n=1 Tax=Mycobacterium leprae TaxID=1769 RepID=UPI000AD256EE|nr:DUF1348 family protein [Mycobacterium leprae]
MSPFTVKTAIQKVQLARNVWNNRYLDHALDSQCRRRSEHVVGRVEIVAFLACK